MDIIYMKKNNGFRNDSNFVQSDFIVQNPGISIPYLILISISTVTGCIGNAMVIGSVATYKVLINLFIQQSLSCVENETDPMQTFGYRYRYSSSSNVKIST